MAFGIGSALKRGAKSIKGRVKATGRGIEREVRGAGRGIDETSRKVDPLRVGKDIVGKLTEVPEIPGTEEVTPMPLPDDELSRTARRRSRAKRRGGRSSSILTGSDTLG